MKKRKILSIFLALAMVLSLLPVSALAEEPSFTDVEGHWGESAIERWSDYGVVSGKGGGIFDPDANMTRAEMAQMYVNLLNLTEKADISNFTDVPANAWYADAVAKCVAAGILNGTSGTTISPNGTVTREQMFVTFGRAVGLTPVESTDSQLSDLDDVSDWAEGMVNALLEAGYISGMGNNTLQPGADINRASVMALLDKSVAVYANESGATVTGNGDNGLVLVVADDVTITGTVGDVIVAQGAAEGTVTLENATVTGTVTVNAPAARVSVAGETTVENLVVAEDAQGAQVSVEKDAAVASVSTAAEDTTLAVSGKVENVTTSGANTTVSGSGTVNKVEAAEGSTGATVTTPGTTVENNGFGSVTTDKGEVKPGETGTTAPSGGSSSGGSTGGGSTVVTTATVSTLEALNAALENTQITTINISGTIGSAEAYATVNVTRPVTIKGGTVNGSFVVTADGAVFDGVTIQNPGQDTYGAVYKNGINAYTKNITIKNCIFNSGAEFANGVVIFPSDTSVTYTITGNTFNGYDNEDNSWSTTGLMITGNYNMENKPFFNVAGNNSSAADIGAYDADIIAQNTFTNCANDYVRNDYPRTETVYAALNYVAFSRAADSATFVFTRDVDLSGEIKVGTTVTVAEGVTATVAADSTLTVNGALTVNNGTLTNDGTINGSGTVTAPGYVKSGDNWVQLFDGGDGTETSPYEIATAEQLNSIVSGSDSEHLVYYRVVERIDLKDVADNGIGLVQNIVFDGNNTEFSSSQDGTSLYGLFKEVRGTVTIRNLTYDLTNCDSTPWAADVAPLIYQASGSDADILIENVTIKGTHTVDSNNGPFVMNEFLGANSTLTLKDCEMAASLSGDGYNACFIGWQTNTSGAHIVLDSCKVSGELTCPRASIVTANGSNAAKRTYEYKGTNVLSGTVRGTSVAKYFTAVSETDKTSFESEAEAAFTEEDAGALFVGQDDANLAISIGEDGRLIVTASSNSEVTSYEVKIGLYTHYYTESGIESGTWKYFAAQTVTDLSDLSMYNYMFIDANYSGLGEITTDTAGNKIATLNGTTYYVVEDYKYSDIDGMLQGYVGSPSNPGMASATIIQVTAYVGDAMYSSATLK